MFSSTLWTFVTCLPYRLLYLTNALCIPCHEAAEFSQIFIKLTNFFFSILVLGIVINPLISIITQRLYRQCVLTYFQRFLNLIQNRWCNQYFNFLFHFKTSASSNNNQNGNCQNKLIKNKFIKIRKLSSNSRNDLNEISKLTQAFN